MRMLQFLTDYIQILNIFITIISIFAAEIHILSGGYSQSTLVWINVYIFVWLVYLVWKFLSELDDGERNYREDISFSFAMISICGIVARGYLFYFCDSVKLVQFFWFFTFNALSTRFYIPVQLSREYYKLPYTKNAQTIILISSILTVGLLLSFFVAAGFPESFNEIMIPQVYYSFFTASLIDYMINLTAGIEEYEEPVEQQSVLLVRERPLPRNNIPYIVHRSPNQSSLPDCQSCFPAYNERAIPRTLTCGHTICQACIEIVIGETDRFCCPICQEDTTIHGWIYLPRNHPYFELTGQ